MGLFTKLFARYAPASEDAPQTCAAILVAAGSATRMGGIDKILCPVGNEPIVLHALRPLQDSPLIDEIVLVTREDLMVALGTLCSRRGIDKVRRVVRGGDTRTESVLAGLAAVSPGMGLVAIHDGARPFMPQEVIDRTIEAARTHHAAAPALPVKDTIKQARDGVVVRTPDRAELFAVQTPQVFDIDRIRVALQKAQEGQVPLTDDCSAVERLGYPVHLVEGSEEGMKVTTPSDLAVAEAILANREG